MRVLKNLITYESNDSDDDAVDEEWKSTATDVRHRLLCIVTAFELLSGQGESINSSLSRLLMARLS